MIVRILDNERYCRAGMRGIKKSSVHAHRVECACTYGRVCMHIGMGIINQKMVAAILITVSSYPFGFVRNIFKPNFLHFNPLISSKFFTFATFYLCNSCYGLVYKLIKTFFNPGHHLDPKKPQTPKITTQLNLNPSP